jgi:hypothetical protein
MDSESGMDSADMDRQKKKLLKTMMRHYTKSKEIKGVDHE